MKKRILSILLTLCMVLALFPVTAFAEEPTVLKGDIDLDGEVTIRDAIQLQNYLERFEGSENFTDEQLAAADYNGDNKVDYSDWTALQSYLENRVGGIQVSDITVTNGKATACGTVISKAAEGTRVTLTADPPSDNMVFDKWIVNEGNDILKDASSATTTFAMPADPVSVTATYKQKDTLTVPFTTTVKQGGSAAPGKTVFELELVNERGEKLSFDDVKVTGSVTTNGKGSYKSDMTFTGSLEDLYRMLGQGAFVKQVDAGADGWTVDDTVWGLRLRNAAELAVDDAAPEYTVLIFPATKNTDDGGLSYSMVDGANQVDQMTFTNTYTKSTTVLIDPASLTDQANPQTGDNSHMVLWMALLFVSGGLLTVTVIKGAETEQKRRRHE